MTKFIQELKRRSAAVANSDTIELEVHVTEPFYRQLRDHLKEGEYKDWNDSSLIFDGAKVKIDDGLPDGLIAWIERQGWGRS